MIRRPPRSTRTDTLFPYTTLFRSSGAIHQTFIGRNMKKAARRRTASSGLDRQARGLFLQHLFLVVDGCGLVEDLEDLLQGGGLVDLLHRSEERRVGKEGVSTGRSRWSQEHKKKKKYNIARHKVHET